MSTNYPSHPIYSWRPTIAGSVTWNDGTHSSTIDLSTAIGSSYWGWYSDVSNNATASSIQGRLAAQIQTGLVAAGVAATLGASYTWPDGDGAPPLTEYTLSHPGSVNLVLTFTDSATAAQFGINGTTWTLTYLTAKAVDFTDAGHWQPSCLGGYDERWDENPNVGITETIDGSSRKLRTWGGNLTRRGLSHPSVMVANIRADAALEASQIAAAQRHALDPNSTLEVMLRAARTPESTDNARAFEIFTGPGLSRRVYFVEPDQVRDLQALCSNASVRRIWGVSVTVRDDG